MPPRPLHAIGGKPSGGQMIGNPRLNLAGENPLIDDAGGSG